MQAPRPLAAAPARALPDPIAPWLAAGPLLAVRASLDLAAVLGPGTAGTVLSAHAGAVNLWLQAPGIPDGRLVALLDEAGGGIPGAILLARRDVHRLAGLRRGDGVRAEGRRLRFDSGLVVDLAGAASWDPRVAARRIERDGLARRLDVARHAAGAMGPGGVGPGTPFAGTVAAATEQLAGSLLDPSPGGAARAAAAGEGLVGLGPGLTPSGDDLLVGLTAALTAAGHPWARSLAAHWARLAETTTTPVAAAFHRHAAGGDYAERVTAVADAVLQGSVPAVVSSAATLAAWGATSGRDTLAGLVLGLDGALAPRGAES